MIFPGNRSRFVLSISLLMLTASCGRGGAKSAVAARAGSYGQSYLVSVSRPTGGTITSADGQIYCGTAPAANQCGPATYAWGATATLTATPDAGFMFGTWAGDCGGRQACVLGTGTYGADKYVLAVFGAPGRTIHENFSDPALHGPEFLAGVAKAPDAFDCAYCHGATYAGVGIAPSCNDCHAKAGAPNWLSKCDFCHGAPPPPNATTSAAIHPAVSSDLTTCSMCHPDTVTAAGTIVIGGKHMDGVVEATGGGHAPGFAAPAMHAPEFFAYVSGTGGLDCTGCHGKDYGTKIANNQSCNSCHAGAGWTSWLTNCSFCHGVKSLTTQLGGYDVAANPTYTAPPDDLSKRLTGTADPTRTGAHALHLTGSAIAGAFKCETCHAVPTSLTPAHLRGRSARATVTLSGANQGALAMSLGTYDPASGTCATYCHSGASPAWSSARPLACDGCHGAPPATADHASVTADLTKCSGCHPDTMNGDGTINLAGGKHLDGAVEAQGHPAGFAAPAQHGPQYLVFLGGTAGATDCTTCHGASLGSCTTCHSANGWTGWQSNCTFCHGTRTKTYGASSLALAAPPDAVSQRLDGIAEPLREGKHAAHLARGYDCMTCHPLPFNLVHVRGATARAIVVVNSLWGSPATYTPASSSCTSYCHGSSFDAQHKGSVGQWVWNSNAATATCGSCHADPPTSPAHAGLDATSDCGSCHPGYSATAVNPITHMDGQSNVICTACHSGPLAGTDSNGVDLSPMPASGAHLRHLQTGILRTPMTCGDCHVTPDFSSHPSGLVEFVWSDLASGSGTPYSLTPSPTSTTPGDLNVTCTNYCHGSSLSGARSPSWNGSLPSSSDSCRSCHAAPPATAIHQGGGHPNEPCFRCHYGTMDAPWVDDGTGNLVQWTYNPDNTSATDPNYMFINPNDIAPDASGSMVYWWQGPPGVNLGDYDFLGSIVHDVVMYACPDGLSCVPANWIDRGLTSHVNGGVNVRPAPYHSWSDNPTVFWKGDDGTWTCNAGCHSLNFNGPTDGNGNAWYDIYRSDRL